MAASGCSVNTLRSAGRMLLAAGSNTETYVNLLFVHLLLLSSFFFFVSSSTSFSSSISSSSSSASFYSSSNLPNWTISSSLSVNTAVLNSMILWACYSYKQKNESHHVQRVGKKRRRTHQHLKGSTFFFLLSITSGMSTIYDPPKPWSNTNIAHIWRANNNNKIIIIINNNNNNNTSVMPTT